MMKMDRILGLTFLRCIFISGMIPFLEGGLTDVTTIYQVLNLDNEPIDPLCHVSIRSGSESKYLPYLINNELVFPKVSSLENGKEHDLNKALLFDSNNHTNSRWSFDGSRYRVSDLSTTLANHDEPLYTRLVEKIRVKFIVNPNEYESLKTIVQNKSGRSTTSTAHSIPDIMQQSELFHHQCKACRVDLYKLNNKSGWDLKLGNIDYEKEDSIERSIEYKDDLDLNHGGQWESRTVLGHNSTGSVTKQHSVNPNLASITVQHNDSDESPVEDIILPLSNQLLFTLNNLDNQREAILNTKLSSSEETKYVLKVQFKVQSYFKLAFLVSNSTDEEDYGDLIEVTVRGSCEEVDLEAPYYVDISTGSDFKSWLISAKTARHQTMTFLLKSREYVYMQAGLVDYTIQLRGARLSQVEVVPICSDKGFNTFQYELYESTFSYFSLVTERTKSTGFQADWAATPSLTSPWIVPVGNEQCLTILYSGDTSDSLLYEFQCYNGNAVSQEISVNVVQLTARSITPPYCVERNGQYARMIVKYNESLRGAGSAKAYRFLVTISSMVKLRLIYASNCSQDDVHIVKHTQHSCDAMQKVAYDVAYHHNYNKRGRSVQYCANQGKLVQGSCVCPPGFYGDHCEEACGANKFGTDCSGKCATNPAPVNAISLQPSPSLSASKSSCQGLPCDSVATSESCRGALLCTHYGCVCAPGYRGKYCAQHCDQGYYGNDCQISCGECAHNRACNIYTGHCSEGCATPYLIPPYCKQSYPYVTKPLQVLNATYFSVLLRLDAHQKYIKGYSSDQNSSYWFQLQARSLTWNTTHTSSMFLLDLSNPNSTYRDIWMENLVPGDEYSFQILLYDKDNRTHNPQSTPMTNATTDCIHSNHEYNYRIETTSTTLQIHWTCINNSNDGELVNQSIQKLKTIYSKDLERVTTVDAVNRLLTKYNTSIEDVEELFNLNLNIVYSVFECKRRHYTLRVRKDNGQKGQTVKVKHIQSGFTLKNLDPGHAYFLNLYWEDNNQIKKDIFRNISWTKNEVSEIPFKTIVTENRIVIKWNSTNPRVDKSKSSRSDSRTNPQVENSQLSHQIVYYIKYRITQQQACQHKGFNENWSILATTKSEAELKLNYFTKYSLFVTLNKGQTWSTKYMNLSVAPNVPEVAPNLLHVKEVTAHSAHLAWADISLSNHECARLNGVFVEYELEVSDLLTSRIRVYNQTNGFSQEVDGLTSRTEYEVKLRYVNHVGKNPAVFADVKFTTL